MNIPSSWSVLNEEHMDVFKRKPLILYRDGAPLLELHQATTWLSRLRGLFAYPSLSDSQALLINPCNAVHTLGLKYSIDVVFRDKRGIILKMVRLTSGSIAACWQAQNVIEMRHGTAERLDLQVGQALRAEASHYGDLLHE